jgi:hypothetical protein
LVLPGTCCYFLRMCDVPSVLVCEGVYFFFFFQCWLSRLNRDDEDWSPETVHQVLMHCPAAVRLSVVCRANATEANALVPELVTRVQHLSSVQRKEGLVELPTQAVRLDVLTMIIHI